VQNSVGPPVFPVLDTLRALGAVAVVGTHTSFWAGAYLGHGIWGTLLSRLDIGVAVFFVLSGFLLSRPWLARAQQHLPLPSVPRYLRRRSLRVLPVYLVAACAALLLLPADDGADGWRWVRTLTLTDLYVAPRLPPGLTQMWSLATEVAFYLVLPGLMVLALGRRSRGLRPRRVAGLLVALPALSLLWIVDLAARVGDGRLPVLQWLPSYLGWFALGIGLALTYTVLQGDGPKPPAAAWLAELGRAPGACWTAALALLAIAATPLAGPALLVSPTVGQAATKNVLYAAIAGLVVLPSIFARADGGYVRLLSAGWLRHLGHLSYGIFCIHLVVLELLPRAFGYTLFGGHGLALFGLTLGASIALSEVLYRLVESPFVRLGHAVRRSGRSTSSQPSATTAAS
jgi:peptidoglycan/LPS O-acetylase OafA/YrhL